MDADPGPGGDFDVQEHGPLHLTQERCEVVPHVAAQLPEFRREPVQPLQRLGAELAAVRGGPVLARQPVEGLDQAGGVREVAFDHRSLGPAVVGIVIRGIAGPAAAPGEEAGPVPQGHQVRGANPPARPGEQAHQRIRAARIGQDPEGRDEVDDLGGVQQPAESDDLVRNPAHLEFAPDAFHLGAPAAQHRHGGRLRLGCRPRRNQSPGTSIRRPRSPRPRPRRCQSAPSPPGPGPRPGSAAAAEPRRSRRCPARRPVPSGRRPC